MLREDKDIKIKMDIKISSLPDKPGVYLFKNGKKKIIYIGKARSLRYRVRSYFVGEKDIKTEILLKEAADIEVILTRNEYEALLLENSLIKQWKPRFNINLKDGKSYPVIRITKEEYPRVFRTRRIYFDGSDYYGPYPKANQIDLYLNIIEKYFPLRKCRGKLKKRSNPCLYYHIKRCYAPCCGYITKEGYSETIKKIKKLLSGKTHELALELKKKMEEASKKKDYEQASSYRDKMKVIEHISLVQQVIDVHHEAKDYIGYAIQEHLCTFVVMKQRNGFLIGREIFSVESYSSNEEALVQFIIQYYSNINYLPSIIYLRGDPDKDSIETFFHNKRQSKIVIKVPKIGKHLKIIKIAEENAQEDIENRKRKISSLKALEELKEVLGLKTIPSRIEGFDISHLSGKYTVGSMVSFLNGFPDKSSYRYFKLRTLNKGKIDDFQAIREVVARRYTRLINENKKKPDLILIDGGKGQVKSAFSVLMALNLSSINLIGLAKKREEIFIPGKKSPLILDESSLALNLLTDIRNESHRFAINLNKRLRKASVAYSVLEEFNYIGPKRSNRLLNTFGSISGIIKAGSAKVAKEVRISLPKAEELILSLIEFQEKK